jgi:hypothetical protein
VLTLGYLSIGYSRFVLGAHASNQIFYGFLLGGWSLLMCVYFLGPRVQRLVDMLKKKQLSPEEQKSALTSGYALTFFMVLAQTLVFLYVDSLGGFDIPANLAANIQLCSGQPVIKSDVMSQNFTSAGAVTIAIGAFAGVVYRYSQEDMTLVWVD